MVEDKKAYLRAKAPHFFTGFISAWAKAQPYLKSRSNNPRDSSEIA
jgi:hypothetical protein